MVDGGSESIGDFLTNPQPQIYKIPRFDFEYLNYHELISFYINLFGKANVRALPYELMANDFEYFSKNLNGFFGIDLQLKNEIINQSRPKSPVFMHRFLNRAVGKSQLSPGGFVHVRYIKKISNVMNNIYGARAFDKAISANWEKIISNSVMDYYAQSNSDLQKLLKMDLEKFGYIK